MNLLDRGPKIVAIGGGTGLSTMLSGLKKFTSNITAVVTVSDNGGGSGILRQEMNILPPGDIRNCILALANTEPVMERLLQYRFKEGSLKGQSFGNLFLAAMTGISKNFEEAVQKMSEVLAVTGKVLPVTKQDVQLCAKLGNGEIICGETEIVERSKKVKTSIKEIYLYPKKPEPLFEVLDAIENADAIILGPGSLYTSIIPNLLVKKVPEAIQNSKAIKIYIGNVMTQPGETDGFDLLNHIEELEKYGGENIIDYVIINTETIPKELLDIYKEEGAEAVKYDIKAIKNKGFSIVLAPVLKIYSDKKLVRHNSYKLAKVVMEIIIKHKEFSCGGE
ncbi:gluconeogenesis factor YvcK family protein [Defluviitalea phaphyphila]|uniref:gluconeogenesis factor YvcK family protein n=1 Tax=Defluviitalea phaphyphila TaxID=1473580 RepID=UPI000731AB72|nr:YvcK family protein [Defluviitalea phaphyphila]